MSIAVPLVDHLRRNQLLGKMPADAVFRLLSHLNPVVLSRRDVLCESGRAPTHVYFPLTAVVSLQYVTEQGETAELAPVGNEGMVGIPLFTGGDSIPIRAVVRADGAAMQLTAQAVRDEADRGGPFMHALLRYTQALLTQMAQTAVCNRHHSLDQQLCRWLLLSLDRLQGNKIEMTQELIANMLGVRREGVTETAGRLQRSGLIRYARGHITVLDRAGLERRSCECYGVVKREYDRLLAGEPAT
jgi:CRP-like cAMP-binding protein